MAGCYEVLERATSGATGARGATPYHGVRDGSAMAWITTSRRGAER